MPRIKIDNASRSKEEILAILKNQLEPMYSVSEKTMMLGSDVVIKKNALSGIFVSVNVNAKKGITIIGYEKDAPNVLLRGPVAKLFGSWKISKDLKSIIETLR